MGSTRIVVTSVAQVMGTPNVCLLALEKSSADALKVDNRSTLEGKSCSIFSDLISPKGLSVRDGALLKATSICSAGGTDTNSSNNIVPPPYSDCPQFDDPLASRPEPSVEGCTYRDYSIKNTTSLISPGVYCGGLKIEGHSIVTALAGLYIISDGKLELKGNAELKGIDVSFYLTGTSQLRADEHTKIQLEAQKSGPLAGILFFGSRKQSTKIEHNILSREAQKLVGTIYFPVNALIIGSEYGAAANVGNAAAYTAIVARRILVRNRSTVTLNSDYHMTDVPVPEGIKGAAQPVSLVK